MLVEGKEGESFFFIKDCISIDIVNQKQQEKLSSLSRSSLFQKTYSLVKEEKEKLINIGRQASGVCYPSNDTKKRS